MASGSWPVAGEPAPDRGILEMAKHFYIQKGARKQEDMERRSPKTKAWNSKFGAGAGHYPQAEQPEKFNALLAGYIGDILV